MNEIPDLLVLYLALMNILAFVAFGKDKAAARRGQRRIPEKTLFQMSLLGGSAGALIGMHVFHHKTRHYVSPVVVAVGVVLWEEIPFGFLQAML